MRLEDSTYRSKFEKISFVNVNSWPKFQIILPNKLGNAWKQVHALSLDEISLTTVKKEDQFLSPKAFIDVFINLEGTTMVMLQTSNGLGSQILFV